MSQITYLGQDEATKVDEELMGPLGFSVDQLMELAGLSVASAVAAEYPVHSHSRVLIIAGPGNNGGDGLVAARHLYHFGYKPQVCYPKQTKKPLYEGLVTQLKSLYIPFIEAEQLQQQPLQESYDVVLDAMFGFSFKGEPRPPFDTLIQMLTPKASPPPVASVDIPSGWHVENGDESGSGIQPEMLISLTTPKKAAKNFHGKHHYLGGRFVPPAIKDKYKLHLPKYPGTAQCVKLNGSSKVAERQANPKQQGEGAGSFSELPPRVGS
jgi:NAD(P)H-hydrate epimerase